MKPFDDKLTERIVEVFGAHQEPYNPEAWKKLQEKRNKKKRKLFLWLPFWAKAAVFVFIFALSSIISYNIGVKRANIFVQSVYYQTFSKQNDRAILFTDSESPKIQSKYVKKAYNNDSVNKYVISNTGSNKISRLSNNNGLFVDSIGNAYKLNDSNLLIAERLAVEFYKDAIVLDSNNSVIIPDLENMVFEHELKKKEPIVTWAASVSSYNALPGSAISDQQGVSAGVVSNISISKRLQISTGMLLTGNTIAYNPNMQNALFTKSEMDNEPVFSVGDVETVNSSDLHTVAIDIPLNLKFNVLNSKKNALFFGLGVSSYSYIKQKSNNNMVIYSNRMEMDNLSGEMVNVVTSQSFNQTESAKPFSVFEFASVINFQLEYQVKLKKSVLAFSPYLKYPYKPITIGKTQFTYGGINLAYIF